MPGRESAHRCCYHSVVNNSTDSVSDGTFVTIFLDRDGVVNEKMPEGSYVTRWEEFHLLPGVPEAIQKLNRAGKRVLVASNQRGVALGLYSGKDVEAIHRRLQENLLTQNAHIDGFYFCPHDKSACDCRKPLPGMFVQAQRDFPDINAASSIMLGDSSSDIEFGKRLGMRTIFIEGDPARRKPGWEKAADRADARFSSLQAAVDALLKKP
ncbi:MAG TPA: HAD family hydrolase [Terracidiphilus sp.]|jgi:D-glycero-D-manno-heptose 1,7-bisphosphate phosphatase|nr:HAD family hydrolase [Terracidiphilus sp.]